VHLSDGIQFIVVVIGVFSVSEILLMLEKHHSSDGMIKVTGRTLFNLKEMAMTGWGTLRSAVLGFVVGVLPGAGATIASAMAYTMEKRLNDTEGTFGKGDIRGVAAPEAANNASATGSLCAHADAGRAGLGHHGGDGGCAVALQHHARAGAVQPAARPGVGLIASMFVANVMLLIINIPLVGLFTKILQVPNWMLVPGILAISAVGVYSPCTPPPSTWC
jgi:putative tricarboxylic transport membrane protein